VDSTLQYKLILLPKNNAALMSLFLGLMACKECCGSEIRAKGRKSYFTKNESGMILLRNDRRNNESIRSLHEIKELPSHLQHSEGFAGQSPKGPAGTLRG
jgi:hypothetical protein